jgi:DNA repair protein RadA/Sms
LYISGEESARQIKVRAQRLGVDTDGLYILTVTDAEAICDTISQTEPDVVIIDSIQTMCLQSVASSPGSLTQVRECTNMFMHTAKSKEIPIIIVGHVNKDGNIAGPKVMEHIVDAVLYFEGERNLTCRILRTVKNRFGSTNEIGVFEMYDKGLEEVENPSQMLLSGRPENVSGTCVTCTMEGLRPILAEVQVLATKSGFASPRRMAKGYDFNRMAIIIAVLEKRARVNLSNSDIFINVAGGLKIDETAVDLGICAAITASMSDIVIPSDMMFIGEVGLGGELRAVSQLEKRLIEAVNLGFKTAIAPKQSLKGVKIPKGLAVYGVKNISEAIAMFRK